MADMLWSALSYLGAAVLAYHALALLNVLYKTLLASGPKLSKKYGEVDHKEVLSHVMYPAVYAEYKQAQQSYGDVSTLPTNRFLQPM